jgi:hypothetical protein
LLRHCAKTEACRGSVQGSMGAAVEQKIGQVMMQVLSSTHGLLTFLFACRLRAGPGCDITA